MLYGCVRGPRIDNKDLRSAAKSLDKIDKYLERFGTASVSSMLIVEDKGQFALDYNQPTSEYVSKARTGYQGAAQRFYQYSRDVQQAQVSQIDAEEAAKAALLGGPEGKALLDAGLKVATGLGVTGAGPDTAAALLEREEVEQGPPAFESKLKPNAAAAVLNSPKFSDPLPDIAPPTELSERRALLVGVNDKITENILKYLAHPEGVPSNKLLYIGILEVSVNPGWGTREGYMADVVITPEYTKYVPDSAAGAVEAEALNPPDSSSALNSLDGYYLRENKSDITGHQPVPLAAFPLLEAQTLDLRNSERTQDAFVSYLASLMLASGVSEQNETLTSLVERLEYDSASRSPIPLVTSYSSGDSFGFQFMPAFQALADPADKYRGSANVLHPYSFPAMVLLQCERSEVMPVEDGGLGIRHIRLNVSSRWIPMKDRRTDLPVAHPLHGT